MKFIRFKKTAFLCAALFVAVLAVLPTTGPFLRQQVRFGLGGQWVLLLLKGGNQYNAAEHAASVAVAARQPDNFPLQFALAFQQISDAESEKRYDSNRPDEALLARLQKLQPCFPREPALLAAYLRYASQGGLGRVAEQNLLSAKPSAAIQAGQVEPRHAPTYWEAHPDFVAVFAAIAEQGQRVDAGNAFFPYLHACACLSQNRDQEARSLLKQAASCLHWHDYRAEEVEAQIALQTARQGELPSLLHVSIASAQYSPEGTLLNSAARVFAVSAMQQEQSGDKGAGFAIRHDLARTGALLRRDGSTVFSGMNGRTLVAYAASRPGGAPPLSLSVPNYSKKSTDEKNQLAEARYVSYLNTIGYGEEARWFAAERARERDVKQITDAGLDSTFLGFRGASVVWATAWLVSCYVLLGNLVWVLLAGGIARLAACGARVQDASPLHPAVSRAVTILVGLPFWVSGFVGLLHEAWAMSGVMVTWLTVVTSLVCLVMPALSLWQYPRGKHQEMSRDQRAKEGKRSLILYGKTLGFGLPALTVVCATLPAVLAGPFLIMTVLTMMFSQSGTSDPTRGALWFLTIVSVFASAGLILTVARSLYRSLRYKTPASVGLALALRRVALPLAAVLLVMYAGALLTLSRLEVRAKQNAAASIRHEGRYYAQQTGVRWPDLVPESGSEGVRP